MTALDEILNANAAYANQFDKAGLPAAPGLKLAIVTCMDGRIETGRAFGLAEGDAHVIRNAGGRMSEALRSIIISQVLLGTDAVAVVHHTECGMLSFTDESLRKQIRDSGADADAIAFLPFSDLEQSVRDDVALYHGSPLVRHDVPVRGFIFDLKTGSLNEVV